MRPKKRILLFDTCDNHAILRYVLTTHAYLVLAATSETEAIAVVGNDTVELVLAVDASATASHAAILKLKSMASHIPMVIIADKKQVEGKIFHGADAVIQRTVLAEELLERVKVWSARKRGPRKGVARVLPQLQQAATA